MNKIDKLLTRQTKKREDSNKIGNERGDLKTFNKEILRFRRNYYEQLMPTN